jgi:hypothetical protein
MSQFRNSMMLYRPSLSVWTARKKDKEQSDKANADAGAVDGAANVYKALLPDSPELLAVQKWATAFRTWVYNTTLPWDDNGGRVARVERHMDFMQEAGDRIRAGYVLVDEFMGKYASAREEAKFKLNGMYKDGDYPSESDVRRKFFFTIDCEAVPDAADFRIIDGLPQEEVNRLVADASASVDKRIQAAIDDLYQRLFEVIAKFADTLDDFGAKRIKKFNDTLSTNISDIAQLVPALNLINDGQLAQLGRDAMALCSYDLKELRKDDAVRRAAMDEAYAVLRRYTKGATEPNAGWEAVIPGELPPDLQAIAEAAAAGRIEMASTTEPAATIVTNDIDPLTLVQGW